MVLLQYFVLSCLFHQVLTRNDVLKMEGDVILGGLFDLHQLGASEKACGIFNEIPGYQYMEAMLYALDKINSRKDVLPGIRLGAIIYDTCRSPTITADKTKEFIKLTLQKSTANSSEFAGVIGPFKSANSVIVASFLRVFRIPQISYGSLTVKLSNKEIYNYFFRTVPPDSFFAEALVKLVQSQGWDYVSVVWSTGTWSETGADVVKKAFNKYNVCIADSFQIARFPNDKDFDNLIKKLAVNEQRRVVVLVTIQRDCRGILKAKKRLRAWQLYFIGSLEWSNRDDITTGVEAIADGTISFGHREKRIPEFVNYFESLRFNTYSRNNKEWVGEYWQQTNKCKLKNSTAPTNYTILCTGDEANTKNQQLAPVQVVINAIEAMANALHNMQQRLCPANTSKLCDKMRPLNRTLLLEFLRNVTYIDAAFHNPVSFNENQEVDGNYTLFNFRSTGKDSYDFVKVGSWFSKLVNGSIVGTLHLNQSKIRYNNGTSVRPLSSCKPACDRNQVRSFRDDSCCWECVTCRENDIVIKDTCIACTGGFVPNENLTRCFKLPLQYVNMDTGLSIFFAFMSCVGIFADIVIFAVFFVYRQNKLIKASGREMCYFIFVGIAAIFMVPLTCLAKPTQALCYFRRFIMGIAFTICYAPLLMKMWRIHRIFKNSQQMVKITRTGLIGRRSLLAFTCALIAIQGLFCVLIFNTDPPNSVETFYESKNELVLECSFKKSAFTTYFIYNVLLVLCCTFYAFITRHFPKNFNEAMVIGITMYLTCIIWIIFFATFLNADYSIHRVYWISGCSLVTGWVTLLGLFAPKMHQLVTKTEFSRDMLLSWADSTFSRIESSASLAAECPRCRMRDAELASKNGSKLEPLKLEIGLTNPTKNDT